MQLSAEVRWFWRNACPAETEAWFRRGPGGAASNAGESGEPRIDRYFHARGQTEIGVKLRGAGEGAPDVEVKGLVAVLALPTRRAPLSSGASGRRRR